MTINDKQMVMDTIRDNVSIFKKRSSTQWSIRCPFCGDSSKNINDSHCYIKWTMDESEPLLFNCFLCNKSGIVDKKFLDELGIKKDLSKILDNQKFNKIQSLKENPVEIITGTPRMNSLQIKYIEYRIGKGLTDKDYERFKIIANIENLLPYIASEKIKNSLPSNHDSISFLSDDKTLLLTRLFDESSDIRWKKTRIMHSDNKSFYAIKTTLDLFTKENIVVNIAEGIIDILSVYKNFNDGPNSIFIASLGSDYIAALEYAIAKGFIGLNIIIKIYMDQDQNEKLLLKALKKYKWMFKDIFVYRNILSKDVGVHIEQIKLEERRV